MEFIGHGIYSVPEAARLTNVSNQRIYRWIKGYSYNYNDKVIKSKPVKVHDYSTIDEKYSISFADLIEIRFIDSFKSYGVSWRTIRIAYLRARKILNKSHPFASKKFYTDGHTIFAEIQESIEDKQFIDLVTKQYELKKVFQSYLLKSLDFSTEDDAIRWWPKNRKFGIAIDPNISFGKPIVYKYGIPTSVLYNSYINEESVETVASWFDIEQQSVVNAVEFEKSLFV